MGAYKQKTELDGWMCRIGKQSLSQRNDEEHVQSLKYKGGSGKSIYNPYLRKVDHLHIHFT